MLQIRTITGSMFKGTKVPPILESFKEQDGFLPNGLIGLDMETGLVEVQLTETKTCKMKYGRFLKKIGYQEHVIPEKSAQMSALVKMYKGTKLRFAESEDEIYKVYEDGPYSCMKGYEAVKAYAGRDTAVAYIENEGRIVARTVVVTNEDIGLQYVRIYGDASLMRPMLVKAGYTSGDLEGCSLNKIEDGYGDILCPYLDCGTPAELRGDYIYLTSCGEYSTQDTNGRLSVMRCDGCEEIATDDERMYCEHREMSLCGDCYEEGMQYVDGEYYHEDSGEIKETTDGDWIKEDVAVYSEHHEGWFHEDDATYSEQDNDYYKNNEVRDAWVGEEWDPEPCYKENCLWIRGVLVHEDFEEDYRNLTGILEEDTCPNVKQGILRFTQTEILVMTL